MTSPPPSFILDVHLGKLARYLRILGLDVAYRNNWEDAEIVQIAALEGRTILTRDRGLLQRKAVVSGYLVQNLDPKKQLREILAHFHLSGSLKPYTRCALCGIQIEPATKEEVLPLLPPKVATRYRKFYRCPSCGKVYWKGDHFRSLGPLLKDARTASTRKVIPIQKRLLDRSE